MSEFWEMIRREAVYLWYYFDLQFRQIFLYWVIGMVLGSAVSVFAKKYIHGAFEKLNGRKIGVLGIILASAPALPRRFVCTGLYRLPRRFRVRE